MSYKHKLTEASLPRRVISGQSALGKSIWHEHHSTLRDADGTASLLFHVEKDRQLVDACDLVRLVARTNCLGSAVTSQSAHKGGERMHMFTGVENSVGFSESVARTVKEHWFFGLDASEFEDVEW